MFTRETVEPFFVILHFTFRTVHKATSSLQVTVFNHILIFTVCTQLLQVSL